MRVLFIASIDRWDSNNIHYFDSSVMHFGVSYISSFLKKYGHKTRLLVVSPGLDQTNINLIDEYINKFKPKVVACTSVSSHFSTISFSISYIKKKYPDIYIIIGGPHVSLNPELCVQADCDAICIGEGEYPTLELIQALEKNKVPTKIKNLWIKHGVELEKNKIRSFIKNLDDIPFVDRDIWNEWIDLEHTSCLNVLLGRGCPFNCAYCSNHALHKLAKGPYVRFRSPSNVISELRQLCIDYPNIKEFYFEVETIGADLDWAMLFCEKLIEFNNDVSNSISYGVNLRVIPGQNLNKLFVAFKKANFRFINIGLESGSNRIRKEVLRRNYSNKDVIDAVTIARRNGLQVAFFNLIGLPGETWNDFQLTVKINRVCQPDWVMTSIFYPYPGTDLYNFCIKESLIDHKKMKIVEKYPVFERTQSVLKIPYFSQSQIRKGYVWFEYLIYKNYRNKLLLILGVLVKKMKGTPMSLKFFKILSKIKKLLFIKYIII